MKPTSALLIVFMAATIGIQAGDLPPVPQRASLPAATKPLFDDFEGKALDTNKWLIAKSQWGGRSVNGGVVPDNICCELGMLVIKGHGDKYAGPVRGVERAGGIISPIGHGRRTGACLVTRDCYASGRYEVRMKTPRKLGVCTALWTFHYLEVGKDHEEYVANDGEGNTYISNHEVDIELPGRPSSSHAGISYGWALFNTWVGERDQDMTFGPTKLPFEVNDGKFHTWRFDWHTGGLDGETGRVIEPRVDFYLDGKLLRTVKTTIPVDAGHFWLGLWFPNKWAGEPNFETETLEVDWVRVTPFHEPCDRHKYSQPGRNRFLLGPEQWPRRLLGNSVDTSNRPDAGEGE